MVGSAKRSLSYEKLTLSNRFGGVGKNRQETRGKGRRGCGELQPCKARTYALAALCTSAGGADATKEHRNTAKGCTKALVQEEQTPEIRMNSSRVGLQDTACQGDRANKE